MPEKELFEVEALERTFIRCNHKNQWGAYSLAELAETEDGRKEIEKWMTDRLRRLLWEEDLNKGKRCSPRSFAVNAARLIEHLCGELVKIKKGHE